jgi:hypothetical protein
MNWIKVSFTFLGGDRHGIATIGDSADKMGRFDPTRIGIEGFHQAKWAERTVLVGFKPCVGSLLTTNQKSTNINQQEMGYNQDISR